MSQQPEEIQRAKMKRGALVIGGLFALLVGLYAVTWAVTNRPAKPSTPLLKASQLRGYNLETVSVRARIKRVSSEQRDGKTVVQVSAGFEDNRTGILSFADMEPSEFARWRGGFSEGDWVIVTGRYLGGGESHDFTGCTISPDR
jgi:hypothetical protein